MGFPEPTVLLGAAGFLLGGALWTYYSRRRVLARYKQHELARKQQQQQDCDHELGRYISPELLPGSSEMHTPIAWPLMRLPPYQLQPRSMALPPAFKQVLAAGSIQIRATAAATGLPALYHPRPAGPPMLYPSPSHGGAAGAWPLRGSRGWLAAAALLLVAAVAYPKPKQWAAQERQPGRGESPQAPVAAAAGGGGSGCTAGPTRAGSAHPGTTSALPAIVPSPPASGHAQSQDQAQSEASSLIPDNSATLQAGKLELQLNLHIVPRQHTGQEQRLEEQLSQCEQRDLVQQGNRAARASILQEQAIEQRPLTPHELVCNDPLVSLGHKIVDGIVEGLIKQQTDKANKSGSSCGA